MLSEIKTPEYYINLHDLLGRIQDTRPSFQTECESCVKRFVEKKKIRHTPFVANVLKCLVSEATSIFV